MTQEQVTVTQADIDFRDWLIRRAPSLKVYSSTRTLDHLLARHRQSHPDMVEALREAREALALGAQLTLADPYILIELKALCERAGYGNVMSSASALWRDRLGDLAGGEFVSGPCRSTAEAVIARIDSLLSRTTEQVKP